MKYVLALLLACCSVGLLRADADGAPIERLIRQLGSDDFGTREEAMRQLAKIGSPALVPLRKAAADHGDAEIRKRASELVEKIELADPVLGQKRRHIAALVQRMGNASFKVREAAMSELAKLDKQDLPLLEKLARQPRELEVQRRLQKVIATIKQR
ncbi:MAG: HEAT repeat domain-containing protein [Gemmataceae bacterium]